jgi:5-methylcytosine-specific restriction endonuclease McrA
MPTVLCLEPGCGSAARSRGRCDRHRREQTKRHRSRHNAFYASKRWRITRRRKLFTAPLCELEHPGCEGLATEVHHRVPLDQDDSNRNRYSLEGLVSACRPCHSRESRREQLESEGEGRRGGPAFVDSRRLATRARRVNRV